MEEAFTFTLSGKGTAFSFPSLMVNTLGKDMVIANYSFFDDLATGDYVEKTLKPKGMSTEDYLALTKEALTKQDTEKKKFSYSLQQGVVQLCSFNGHRQHT